MHVFDEWILERIPERLARHCAAQFAIRLIPTPMQIPPLREVTQWHKHRGTDAALIWFRRLLRDVVAEKSEREVLPGESVKTTHAGSNGGPSSPNPISRWP